MKYLIVQDWPSTHGNHAGMVHMCKLLQKKYPTEYEVIIKRNPKTFKYKSNKLYNKIISLRYEYYQNYVYFSEYKKICKPMFKRLSDSDTVFLLEYCIPTVPQKKLAFYIRKKFPGVKLYALSHLTPTFFKDKQVYPKLLKEWTTPIDKMLTLGTSLSQYFRINNIPESKISTGFHYVDSVYYHKTIDNFIPGRHLKVIMMGGMQRDYSMLAEICRNTPFVDWIICRGRKSVDNLFESITNVELKGYLSEGELKHQMDICDISLNIMDDTVGSNVITTSLSMGLAMVCSDVGSIRDYCNEMNTIFCNNTVDSFVHAIKLLDSDRSRVIEMKHESLRLSQSLTIEKLNDWFSSI